MGREILIASAVMLAGALLFTWPLAARLTTQIPSGNGSPTIALFGLFTAEWTGMALEGHGEYWNAPMFHPHRGAFAWAEPQPLASVAIWILSRFLGMIPAYNVALLLYLMGAGLSGYALARQLTRDRLAAMWSGMWIATGACMIQQLGVLHLLAIAFPATYLALILSLVREFRRRAAWGAGLAYLLTMLSCMQYGLFLTLLLPVVGLPLLHWKKPLWSRVFHLAAPMALALLLVSPLLRSQRAHLSHMGFERSLVNVTGSVMPADLITPARGHWLTTGILGWGDLPGVYSWSIGVVPVLMIMIAAALGSFRWRHWDGVQRRLHLALLWMTIAALILAMGPRFGLPIDGRIVGPYALLYEFVPGVNGIRSPARFAVFAMLGAAALSAPAFAALRQRLIRPMGKVIFTVIAVGSLVAEMWAVPIATVNPTRGIDDHHTIVEWLRTTAESGAVLELPMSEGETEAELLREIHAVRRALRHGHPVINGYSGYFPEPFRQIREAVLLDTMGRGRRYMEALGVQYVLVHNHDCSPARQQELDRVLQGNAVFATEQDTIYHLTPLTDDEPISDSRIAANFSDLPLEGDIMRIPIRQVVDRARLFIPGPDASLNVTWPDGTGSRASMNVPLRGSVIVDSNKPWLIAHLIRFSPESGRGEAVLLSQERASPLLQRRHGVRAD